MFINVQAPCILYFRVQVWGKELVKHGVMIKKKTLLEQEISSSDMKVLSKVSIINTMVCHIHI